MNKTAAIYGSTGLIGNNLLKLLIKDKRYSKIIVFNKKTQNYKNQKIEEIIIDFNKLEAYGIISKSDEIYCCIGSTMKKSKTKEVFYSIDYNIPVKIAELTEKYKIKKLLIVSSINANADSRNFYLQTKGKMEQAILKLSINKIHFLRPSMLLGKRNDTRIAETLGQIFLNIFGFVLIGGLKKYRAINATDVAKAMINIANLNTKKIFIESNEILEFAK